jgi:hypothetical protein
MNYLKEPGFLLRLAIAAGYVVLAVYLFLHPNILSFLSKEMTWIFAAVILLYGLFRAYRGYLFYKEQEEDQL